MTALVAWIISVAWPYILGAVAFVGYGVYQRRAGASDERAKGAADRLKARSEADKIDDAIAGRDVEVNRQELRKWRK